MVRWRIIEYQPDFFTGELKKVGEMAAVYEGTGPKRICVVPSHPTDEQLPRVLDHWQNEGKIVSAERIREKGMPKGWIPPEHTPGVDQKRLSL